jgi:hypothetical protein
MCSQDTLFTAPLLALVCVQQPNFRTPSPQPRHYTTVFGRTGSEAGFAPLLQVPPAGGGNQTAVPLAKQGEPHGGGLQKVSCNEP